MQTKNCTKCELNKEVNLFSNNKKGKFGKESVCKECKGRYLSDYRKLKLDTYVKKGKEWRIKNPNYYKIYSKSEPYKTAQKKYYEKNSAYFKKYHSDNYDPIKQKENKIKYLKTHPDKVKESKKNWVKNNPNYYNDYKKERILRDPLFRLKHNIRASISNSFKKNGYVKTSKTYLMVGCSFEDLKLHIEAQFLPWMSWGNYGKYNGTPNHGWDVDHVVPLSSAKTEEDVIRLNHYNNLQPLCSKINRDIKKNKTI